VDASAVPAAPAEPARERGGMRALRLALWPAGAALGLAAEASLYAWSERGQWLPDLATGWSLIACGLVAWSLQPRSRSGAVMAATGGLWFAGNFVYSSAGWLATLSSHALYAYRGPLVDLVLCYPRGRAPGRPGRLVVGAAYAAALLSTVRSGDLAFLVVVGAAVAVALSAVLRAPGRERRERTAALAAVSFVAATVAAAAAAVLAFPGIRGSVVAPDEVALIVLAWSLLFGIVTRPWERPDVTDLVVDLGDAPSGTLASALARTLGDPTLQVGYRHESGGFVDDAGLPLELPKSGDARAVTYLERDGRPVAALVHDAAVLDDPALLDALAVASRLAGEHAHLQADVRAQVAAVDASRRRLLRAADDERRRLAQRLHSGAGARLERVARLLDTARRESRAEDEAARLEPAAARLGRTLDALHELALGLHPQPVTRLGLAHALARLVEPGATPVRLAVAPDPLPDDAAAAAYYVCAEALANVEKHAAARNASITVAVVEGALRVEVADDGAGGADAARGSGLRGLADRVDALGGTLRIASPAGRGTRVVAVLPLVR
jgi:signal transduction histidine kinase